MNSPNIGHTSKDLKIAEKLVEDLAETTSFIEFERQWLDFLFRLERSWEVELRFAKDMGGKAQQWVSKYSAARRIDSLLRFLKHARDAETHAVQRTVDHDFFVSVQDRLSRPFQIESVTTTFEDGVLTYDIKSPNEEINKKKKKDPEKPSQEKNKTRKKRYNPPTEHLGKTLKDLHPVAIAVLGIRFNLFVFFVFFFVLFLFCFCLCLLF